MGKAERNRRMSARENIAAQQAAARRSDRRRQVSIGTAVVSAVLAVVLAFVLIKVASDHTRSTARGSALSADGGVTGAALPATVVKDIVTVPASTLDAVGTGSALTYNPSPFTAGSNATLTSSGKPEMLYIGAEFCPYCAAMRWSMAVALSRFGTFTTPLRGSHSSSTDTDPKTPTLTFYQSGYTSKYLTFTPVENETVAKTPLQSTTSAQQALWTKYTQQSYPFIDFGDKYVIKAPLFDAGILAGMTWAQVAAALHNPASPVAQGADGVANMITAAICKMTNGQPGSVCTSKGVTTATKSL